MKNTSERMNYPVYLAFFGVLLSGIGAMWLSMNQAKESEQNSDLYKQLFEYAKKQEQASESNSKLYEQLAEKSDEIAKYAKEQASASQKVSELQQELIEKADVQIQDTKENAKLSAELAESQREIARLSVETNNSVRGGDSFCYITLYSSKDNKTRIDVFHQGKYPLSNLKMLITNISVVDRVVGSNGPMIRGAMRSRRDNAIVMEVGNLPPSPTRKFVGELDNEWANHDSFFIEFFANNGSWEQDYMFANDKGYVSQTTVVRRNSKVILERKGM